MMRLASRCLPLALIAAILTVACWVGQPQAEAGPARGSGHPRAVWSTLAKPEVQSWLRRYNGSANGDDQAAAVGVSPDGSMVFVGGTVEGATSSFDYGIVAYRAATGVQATNSERELTKMAGMARKASVDRARTVNA